MTREKQIEEMAFNLIMATSPLGVKDLTKQFDYKTVATDLYELYGWRKASDVAREIIDDVKETLLDYHFQENRKYLNSLSKTKKQFDIKTARYRAITDTVKFAIATLAELKKKYTEDGE